MGEFDSDRGLVIVPAGAGAGKTHRIKTQLSDWVKRKVVRPERILAVTFTEAAAGELRERIRAGLLADGLVAEAMAVERAYVSTIHGLGLRLLTEHALAAGASASPAAAGAASGPQTWLTLTLIAGLLVFGGIFAINSALHSYLILAFTKAERVTMDVGFYYMANAGGRLAGTVLSGLTYQVGGLTLMLATAAVMVAASAIASGRLSSEHKVAGTV